MPPKTDARGVWTIAIVATTIVAAVLRVVQSAIRLLVRRDRDARRVRPPSAVSDRDRVSRRESAAALQRARARIDSRLRRVRLGPPAARLPFRHRVDRNGAIEFGSTLTSAPRPGPRRRFSPRPTITSGSRRTRAGYTLLGFLTLVATDALIRALRTDRAADYSLYAIACVAGIYAHLTMALIVAGHVAVVLVGRAVRWRPAADQPIASLIRTWASVGVLSALAYAPFATSLFAIAAADEHRADAQVGDGGLGDCRDDPLDVVGGWSDGGDPRRDPRRHRRGQCVAPASDAIRAAGGSRPGRQR